MSDMDVALRFPSEELALPDVKGLEVYTDAGFAPMKSTGRRSVSGTCFIFQQCLMKCFSRHQSAVTLSSCEAELVALQSGVQEGRHIACASCFSSLVPRVFPRLCRGYSSLWLLNVCLLCGYQVWLLSASVASMSGFHVRGGF